MLPEASAASFILSRGGVSWFPIIIRNHFSDELLGDFGCSFLSEKLISACKFAACDQFPAMNFINCAYDLIDNAEYIGVLPGAFDVQAPSKPRCFIKTSVAVSDSRLCCLNDDVVKIGLDIDTGVWVGDVRILGLLRPSGRNFNDRDRGLDDW